MILEAKNVEYVYKSQKDRKVLGNISMQFDEKNVDFLESLAEWTLIQDNPLFLYFRVIFTGIPSIPTGFPLLSIDLKNRSYIVNFQHIISSS